ncbi:MAG: sugar kinase [Sulfolobales archaeon]|nr:sugar kinase [Sulfolobales archaeon]MCX8198849.1 sugar kinase [Sulfolobales archaeon]MDW8170753.1 sugar kinase [Desulfurococcaceae archaeon]
MELDFTSIGEVMVQLNALSPGPLRYVKYFEVHVAGSESNIMIGLVKLGYRAGIVTKVGDDEFGKLVLNFLRGERVDVSRVKVDESAPTGVYFIQRHYPVPGKSTVFYYRHGSAASRLSPNDIDNDYIANSKALVLTGITPALSDSCREAVNKAYEVARANDVDVIFDTNIRMKLWRNESRARESLAKFLSSKIVFTNIEDLGILFPGDSVSDAASKIISKGSTLVVVKLGEEGAVAYDSRLNTYRVGAFKVPLIEDVIGAGDAFNAVFIASIYRGMSIDQALLYANAAGALVVTVRGDVEAQPSWRELEIFIESCRKAVMLR